MKYRANKNFKADRTRVREPLKLEVQRRSSQFSTKLAEAARDIILRCFNLRI